MDYAIMLYFEEKADRLIHDWIENLCDLGLNDRYRQIGMRPHLTLAEFDTDDLTAVETILSGLASRIRTFELKFSGLGIFPGENGVLFLNPVMSDTLMDLHRRLNRELESCCKEFSPLYRKENWIAHCTLGLDYSEPEISKAYHYLADNFVMIDTIAADLVLFGCCPYHEMRVFPLPVCKS